MFQRLTPIIHINFNTLKQMGHLSAILTTLLLLMSVSTNAQTENGQLQTPISMAFSIGGNFNTGSCGDQSLFPTRPDLCTQFDWRVNVAFARHWSAFMDLGMSFYKIKPSDSFSDIVSDALVEMFLPGVSHIHPSIALGAAYVAQVNRWQFSPRLGFGWMHVKSYHKKQNSIDYEYKITPFYVNPAVSIGYRLSKVCSLILDVSYRCPLTASKGSITYGTGISNTENFKSHGWGNDLSISVGTQLNLF